MSNNIRKQLLNKSKQKGVKTRNAVPAEIDQDDDEDFTPEYHEKSDADQQKIRKILLDSFIFKNR